VLYTRHSTDWQGNTVNPLVVDDITEWNHYLFVSNGTHILAYLNGELKASQGGMLPLDNSDTGPTYIGWDDGLAGRYFNGSMDEVMMFNKALSAREAKQLYLKQAEFLIEDELEKNVVPRLYGSTKLALDFDDNNAKDKTYFDYSPIYAGSITSSSFTTEDCINERCLYFDGTGDNLVLESLQDLDPYETDLSFTGWIKPNLTTWCAIFSKCPLGDCEVTNAYRFSIKNGHGLRFTLDDGQERVEVDNVLSTNTWNFVSVVYNKTNANSKIYVNGILVGEDEVQLPDGNNINDLEIGGGNNYGNDFKGYMDELAFYDRMLTDQEVFDIYNSQKANFIEFKEGVSGSALEFDGENDYIQIGPNEENFPYANEARSVGGWVKFYDTETTGLHDVFYSFGYPYGLNYDEERLLLNNNRLQYNNWAGGNNVVLLSDIDIKPDTWYFVTYTIGPYKNVKLFLNGEMQDYDTYTGSMVSEDLYVLLGASSWSPTYDYLHFEGMLDEFFVYNRELSETEMKRLYESKRAQFYETIQDGVSGKGMYFDGVDDQISFTNRLNEDNTSISFGGWIKPTSNNVYAGIIDNEDNDLATPSGFLLSTGSTIDYLTCYIEYEYPTTFGYVRANNLDIEDEWHQVYCTYDGSEIKFYLDGQLINSTSYSGGYKYTGKNTYLGWDNYAANRHYEGSMDEMGIYKKALSQSEIQDLYISQKAKFIEEENGISGKAFEFDGVDDLITLNENMKYPFRGRDSFSISTWAKIDELDGGEVGPFFGTRYTYFRVQNNSPDTYLVLHHYHGISNGSTVFFNISSINPNYLDNWHHFTATYDVENLNMSIYMDGNLLNSSPINYVADTTYTESMPYLGFTTHSSQEYLNGTLDEFSIYSKALTQTEVPFKYS
jgi:hypothetical protein